MKKKLFLASFALFFGMFVKAQNVVNVTSLTGFPANATFDSTYSFSVGVTYISGSGPTIFAENLRLKYLSDKMIEDGLAPGIFGPSQDVLLELNNPLEIEVDEFTFDSSEFRQGGNIVVIWPSFAGNTPSDSLLTTVQGIDPNNTNGVMHIDGMDLQTIWLNGKINWDALAEFGISEGSLLSVDGKEMCKLHPNIDFNANRISTGIYYFIFNQGNGKLLVFKEYVR